ncbi:MAG TPA: tyrosine-type recombinase/integrase [Bryobacteraceae bacterium]|nr:tyrosine-type recombinase/integrase [Bryobacteraceae bacterium]
MRNAFAGSGRSPDAHPILQIFRKAAGKGKSLIFVSDAARWNAGTRETALQEELGHSLQASFTGNSAGHLGNPADQFLTHPAVVPAARALASRYGETPDPEEIGVRLMRPGGFKEMGIAPAEARSLGAAYVRALRKEHGSVKPRDLAKQVFDALRNDKTTDRRSATEPGAEPSGPRSAGGSRPPGGTGPDLSAYRPPEEDDAGRQRAYNAAGRNGAEERNGEQAGSASASRHSGDPLGLWKFAQEDVVPTVKRIASDLVEAKGQALRMVAPQMRGGAAEYTGLSLRQRMAQFARRYDQGAERLKAARDFFNGRTPQQNYSFIDDIEHGRKTGDQNLDAIAQSFRRMLDQRRREVQALGEGALEKFYGNYFPHIFEKPEEAGQFFNSFFAGKRSMEGPKSFLKHREFPTFKEALDAGLKPVSDNPVTLVMMKAREMDRYLLAHNVLRDLADRGIAKRVSGELAPSEQAEMFGGPIKREWAVAKRNDLPPNFASIRDPIGGGKWYAEQGAADVLNNYLTPGLRAKSGLYRTLAGINNTMNQANLGLSAFHLTGEVIRSGVSRAALGLEDIFNGEPLRGSLRIASFPAGPFLDYVNGSKVLRDWFKPGSEGAPIAAITDALMKGGGRVRMDQVWATGARWDLPSRRARGRLPSRRHLQLRPIRGRAIFLWRRGGEHGSRAVGYYSGNPRGGFPDAQKVPEREVGGAARRPPPLLVHPRERRADRQVTGERKKARLEHRLGFLDEMPRKQAMKERAAVLETINAGRFVVQSQIRFKDLAKRFVESRLPQFAAPTQDQYRCQIENHLLPAFGSQKLCELDRQAVEQFLTAKAEAGLGWWARKNLRSVMAAIYEAARDWKLWQGDKPTLKVRIGRKVFVREKKLLTAEQLRTLLAALPDRLRFLVLIQFGLGLRISEALGLKWKDIDWDKQAISIRRRWYRGDLSGEEVTKTGGSTADLALGASMLQEFRLRYPGPHARDEFLFVVDGGKLPPDDRDLLRFEFRPILVRLGLYYQGFGWHAFRRQNISWRQQIGGATPLEAQKAARHASLDMTYLYTLTDRERETAQQQRMFDELMGAPEGPKQ